MEQRRVAFRFDGETETRYIDKLPQIGDYVTHDGKLWSVSKVTEDEHGQVVVCEKPLEIRSAPSGGGESDRVQRLR